MHCDGGPALGIGHVVRSIALAEEAVARGHRVTVAGQLDGDFLHGLLRRLPVEVRAGRVDLAELAGELRPDVVHLDTYAALEPVLGEVLLSNIEDGSFGRRPADLVIDPNLGAETSPRPDVPAWALLRGASYVPLRSAVTSRRGMWTARDVATRALVVMGGTDPQQLSPRAVAALADAGLPLQATVVAPAHLHDECRRAASRSSELRLELLSEVDDLPALMVDQDLVVSAAGTSVWELCCLGVPMALVCAADNQLVGYDRVVQARAAVGLGTGPRDLDGAAPTLRRLLLDASARAAVAHRASAVVDGRGAWRVVGAWEQLAGGLPDPADGEAVAVRRATLDDAATLLAWRNDADTRVASRASEAVSLDVHLRWLEAALADEDRVLLVGSDAEGDVGTVRWDRRGPSAWEVSITVAPERRGAGSARQLLAAGERELDSRFGRPLQYLASVRVTNDASRRLFVRSGYLLHAPADGDGFELFAKQLAAAG